LQGRRQPRCSIDTPWWDFVPEEQRRTLFAEMAKKNPVGRIGTPEDVAWAIAFLISAVS
jgi:NAD(P)-dependent dehydrogenase (short-subunit alcohol dehydrogenase family)